MRTGAAIAAAVLLAAIFAVALVQRWGNRLATSLSKTAEVIRDASHAEAADPYRQAVVSVEQDRGEAMGNEASLSIPAELKHYPDRRRFLAVQTAAWREQRYEIPDDFAELAAMILRKELTPLPALGRDYILYGVGYWVTDELTHLDGESGKSVPLFGSEAELDAELAQLDQTLEDLAANVGELKTEMGRALNSDPERGKQLQTQIEETNRTRNLLKYRWSTIRKAYEGRARRERIFAEYQALAELARSFDGQTFALDDPASRKELKVRMLSVLRPAARAVLEDVAALYHEKFNRLLPVTSLVRTREYQRDLGESGNPNAARVDVPPHTTGLAFDLYTRFMTAEEQQFLLETLAQMERDGRVEALRELRDHIHVFAFADGHPPPEKLVREALAGAKAGSGSRRK